MEAEARTSWDREYQRGRYGHEPPVPFAHDVARHAVAAGLSGTPALYVGCGNGRNIGPLVDAGLDVHGLDISPTAIEQSRERYPELAEQLRVGTVHDLPSGVDFPVVIGIQVFQHGTRARAHAHLHAAVERVAAGGLLCVRVNAVQTDVHPEHEVIEQADDGGFTVRYLAGPKQGLAIHFFSQAELRSTVPEDLELIAPLRLDQTERDDPGTGQWSQWEGIWRRPGST